MIFISKKGVSPLIATILLIAFAVALGSVVMNWGLNLDIVKPKDKCKNVEIKIRDIDSSQLCYGGFGTNGYINFIIDNTGMIDINGLSISIFGDKGKTYSFDLDNILIKKGSLYDKKDKEVAYDSSKFGSINKIQFIPKVIVDGKMEACTNSGVSAEKIGACG